MTKIRYSFFLFDIGNTFVFSSDRYRRIGVPYVQVGIVYWTNEYQRRILKRGEIAPEKSGGQYV